MKIVLLFADEMVDRFVGVRVLLYTRRLIRLETIFKFKVELGRFTSLIKAAAL